MRKGEKRPYGLKALSVLLPVAVLIMMTQSVHAMTDFDCFGCHGDASFETERDGKTISLYIDEAIFKQTPHAAKGCTSCHKDAKGEGEHPPNLKPVTCANCHDDVNKIYEKSLHGKALAIKDPYAPHCYDCHGKHNIFPNTDKRAKTYVMNIPFTCGTCHKEGSPMTITHDIPKKNILEHYSESIHGEGLFRKGLVVTAVCSSCHTAHNVLPHTDPDSSISRNKIVKICMKCHVNIEDTHLKIVRGELWEKEPQKIPACVECHSPHKTRKALYDDSMNDKFCLDCHTKPEIKKTLPDGTEKGLFVDINNFEHSIHKTKNISCMKCHVNMNHQENPVCKNSGPVDCSLCHADQAAKHQKSIHGQLVAKGDPNGPICRDCHGDHNIMPKSFPESPSFARNIPELCAKCHREGEKATLRYQGSEHEITKHYQESIHGKGLAESGLMVSASCTSCHTAHSILPAKNPDSSVNRGKIVETCAQCHLGIAETFNNSIHSLKKSKTDKKLPVCNDCHTSHTIKRVDMAAFRATILNECGTCHKQETETYFDTYHGKVSLLSGGEKTAKCSDCHGAHDILPTYYTKSRLHRLNVVETCRKCHPNSNRKFTGYLTHATHHDKEKYPYLYYTFWGMSGLLVGTFLFFGLHTLFWIPRSFRERFRKRRKHTHKKLLD